MKKCTSCGAENEDDANFCIQCNTPFRSRDTVGSIITELPDEMRPQEERRLLLEPGEVFANRYEIIEQIGQGGMGVVYKSREKLGSSVERDIALKLIRSELLVNEAAIDKLVHEGVLTQKIRHKNVVAVHNVGVFEGQPFVAMEYVQGLSMREWLQRKFNFRDTDGLKVDIPFNMAAQIVRELLAGLGAAHELGIVHRDLKPENIIFTGEPTAESATLQILDFGIARAPGPAISTASGARGTYEYMAQEQKTNPAGVEPSADLYSLSIIFYEMLMEVLPKNEGRDLAGTRGDVPEGVAALISRGLANSPRGRPQSVAEYRKALNEAVDGTAKRKPQPVTPKRKTSDPEKGKHIPSPPQPTAIPKPVLVGGGIGLAVVALIGLASIPDDPVRPDPPPDPPPGPMPSEPSSPFAGYNGTWYLPDGSYFPTSVGADGNFQGQSADEMNNIYTLSGSLSEARYTLQTPIGNFTGSIDVLDNCSLEYIADAGGEVGVVRIVRPTEINGYTCP